MDQQNEQSLTELARDLGSSAVIGKMYEKFSNKKRFPVQYPPTQRTYEIIVEVFGVIPLEFIDDVINAANESIYRAINRVETLLEYSIDKNFDIFELYALRNIFNIPSGLEEYIKLPYNTASGCIVSKKEQEKLFEELKQNSKKLVQKRLIGKKIKANLEALERQLAELEPIEASLKIIFKPSESNTSKGIVPLLPEQIEAKAQVLEPQAQKLALESQELYEEITDPLFLQTLNKPTNLDSFLNYHINLLEDKYGP
ncbi:hypothetical protein BB560_000800 [Smittium megazygosporum]|uniref:Uncharacterized protein n=1 Tax=Smittium megazygosporum TaxID=133381 RepID=A0A2T9ZJB9_9FUNG|nr:hypothetical protein BB560_000800 [Smittium megazygosporum]